MILRSLNDLYYRLLERGEIARKAGQWRECHMLLK